MPTEDAENEKRILILNSHEAWVAQIDGLPLLFDIAVGLSGRSHAGWDIRMRPVPKNARLLSLEEALMRDRPYQAVIAHSITDLLDVRTLNVPKLFVIHTTLEGRLVEQGSALPAHQIAQETATYLKLISAHAMAVSALKQRSWGIAADIVGFATRILDYPVATQECAQGIRVSNHFNLRRKILNADFHEQAFDGLPVEFVGLNDDMPGVSPAADWDDLKARLSRSRFFIHTADPMLEDGYNMATVEAMSCGLPVLGNHHPSSVVEHGITGFLSDDPEQLREYAKTLLTDRELALKMGARAREAAGVLFSRDRFEEGFLRALRSAKAKFYNKPTRKPAKSARRKKTA